MIDYNNTITHLPRIRLIDYKNIENKWSEKVLQENFYLQKQNKK